MCIEKNSFKFKAVLLNGSLYECVLALMHLKYQNHRSIWVVYATDCCNNIFLMFIPGINEKRDNISLKKIKQLTAAGLNSQLQIKWYLML